MAYQLDYLLLEHNEDTADYLTPTTMKQEYEDEEEDDVMNYDLLI
jgi:hypothetical protein